MSAINATELRFELPMPPSANHLFSTIVQKGKTRRITTREYKAWRNTAAETLMAQYEACGRPSIDRHARLHIRLNLNHQSDIANREKAITDLLVAHLDMPDDCWIDRILIERDRTIESVIVVIGEGS